MTDDDISNTIVDLLMSLLEHPGASWPKYMVDSLHTDVNCGEYENPLRNIIAMGLQSEEGFDASQLEKLNTLIGLMNLEGSEWVIKLRQYECGQQTTSAGDHK
jgi:hypothetical protein